MSRCASCSQWFIIGDAKTIQNGSRVHLKCALTINNNQINNNFTIIAPEPNIADVNPIIDPNDVHEEVRGAPILVGTWNCAVCTLINDTQNEMCELCGSFRDVAVPQNDIENEIQERWVCQICTFDSNHPIATYCAACGLDRGQQLPPPNILPAEHPGPAPEPALEPILEPPPVLVPVPAPDLALLLAVVQHEIEEHELRDPDEFALFRPAEDILPMEQLEANVELPPVAEPIVDVPLIVEAPAVVEPPVLAVEHEAPVVNEAALEGADGADAARIVVNVDVVVPSIAASAVTAPVQATVPVASFCVSCDCELTNSTRYTAITGCTPHCRDCLAQWTETQIMSGNSMTLKCLCGHHKLRYVDFRSLSTLLSTQAKTVYSTAQRQTASSAESVELECPGCATMVTVYAGQVTYECFNHNYCEAKNRLICVRHNTIHLRPLLERYGGGVKRDMHAQPRCARCLQEAGGNADVAAVLFEIQNAMCDRCYACKGLVGEPEDFTNCMVLKCNHCPNSFCGFCYRYAGDWQSAHQHVRYCSENPRQNYFAESEAVWRGLMRQRRIALADAIIDKYDMLTPEQVRLVRDEYVKFL